ncbi:hypothetical protein EC990672_5162 [Escherichia coli 99.0672]|nr:hypothetical protein ECFRIK1990_5299 [Escherichia coli FRIK1990]EIN50086.1 hypothetical protein ECPA3_5262 [Escherichia coli PA3]EIN96769.1 hypothetical protein ECPA28_5353 [Escherichia coli PA28]EIP04639.1 hypothetical protein ECTW14313_5103 [Escherichia coli O157:H7 str. TW14313]EKG99448.1 hypothetical protein ECPA34_5310 [Escherichia coli PA34]EKH43969.1 hypothetical protein ECNE037_5546 [Escherichia coli NE037]EKI06756.1 hypothetical protein EC5412_5143 [Escherichia coli 5412]EKI60292
MNNAHVVSNLIDIIFSHYHSSRSLRWYSTPSSSHPCHMPKALVLTVCD